MFRMTSPKVTKRLLTFSGPPNTTRAMSIDVPIWVAISAAVIVAAALVYLIFSIA